MHLLLGSAACFTSVALYAWAYAQHHRDDGPSWAKGQLFASLVSLVVVALAPLGAGLIALGLTEPFSTANAVGYAAVAVAGGLSVVTAKLMLRADRSRPVARVGARRNRPSSGSGGLAA